MNTFYEQIQATIPGEILKTITTTHVRVDQGPFSLHYKATTLLMLLCVALVTCGEYFGSRIDCLPVTLESKVVVKSKFLQTYCFIQPTFTVHLLSNTGGLASDLVAGGPQHIPGKTKEMYHVYYQWIPFVLFLQAFLFYFPHYVWTNVENNRLISLLQGLHARNLQIKPSDRLKAIKNLGKYLWDSRSYGMWWSYCYVLCEYMNFGVVLLNVYFTNLLLGKHFATYGIDMVKAFDDEEELDFTESPRKLFPTVSKCIFRDYGASGSVQTLSTVCVLPMNVVNERVFTFLWFWYIFLAVTTGTFLMYRTATMLSFRLRQSSIIGASTGNRSKYTHVLEKLELRGWILLKLLSLNLDQDIFQSVILQVHEELLNQYRDNTSDD